MIKTKKQREQLIDELTDKVKWYRMAQPQVVMKCPDINLMEYKDQTFTYCLDGLSQCLNNMKRHLSGAYYKLFKEDVECFRDYEDTLISVWQLGGD